MAPGGNINTQRALKGNATVKLAAYSTSPFSTGANIFYSYYIYSKSYYKTLRTKKLLETVKKIKKVCAIQFCVVQRHLLVKGINYFQNNDCQKCVNLFIEY